MKGTTNEKWTNGERRSMKNI